MVPPVEVEVPSQGTHEELRILLGWIGCVLFLVGTERIGPSNVSQVVVFCIYGVVAS